MDDNYSLLSTLYDIRETYDKIRDLYRSGEIYCIALDVETTDLSSFLSAYPELLLFSISWGNLETVTVPYNHKESPFHEDKLKLQAISNMTTELLSEVPIVGHNIKFDVHWLHKFGIDVAKIAGDTYLASWTLFNNTIDSHALQTLATKYTGFIDHKQEMQDAIAALPKLQPLEEKYLRSDGNVPRDCVVDDDGVVFRKRNMGDVSLDITHRYCCADTAATLCLHYKFTEMLERDGLLEPHNKVAIPAILPVVEMERKGIKVDIDKLEEIRVELRAVINDFEKWFESEGYTEKIYKIRCVVSKKPPKEVKINYWLNKAILLFDILGVDEGMGGRKKKPRCTDRDVIAAIRADCLERQQTAAKIDRPYWDRCLSVVDKLITYAKHAKTLSHWVERIPKACDDNSVGHADFGLRTTETFRWTCKGQPGWHGIKRGSRVKDCVVPLHDQGLIGIFDYCVVGETEIITIDGVRTIADVINDLSLGKDVAVMSSNPEGQLAFKKVTAGAPVGEMDVYRVTTDNGSTVECTSDHTWMDFDGQMIKTSDLVPGQRLLHVKQNYSGPGKYTTFYTKFAFRYRYAHRMTSEYSLGETPEGYQVDHIDGDPSNWVRDNIRFLTRKENAGQGARRWWDNATEDQRKERTKKLVAGWYEKVGSQKGELNHNYGKRKGVTKSCLVCGSEFYCPQSTAKTKKFCSRSCFKQYAWTTAKCDTCSSALQVRKNNPLKRCRQNDCSGRLVVGENHRVSSVEFLGRKQVFQITVDDWHTYVLANGLVSGNSQMELRILSILCQDENMIQAFRDDKDIHSFVAAMCTGKPESKVTKQDRTSMKAVSLGVAIGGRGPQAVAEQLGCSVGKAKKIVDTYMAAFPSVLKYFDQQKKLVTNEGKVFTKFGFRRLFPDDNRYAQHDLDRRAINTPIQSAASDIMTLAMSDITKALQARENLHSSLWATVHDSICLSIHPGEVWELIQIANKMMAKIPEMNLDWLNVRLKVDFEVGTTWGSTCTFTPLEDRQIRIVGATDNFVPLKIRMLGWDKPPKPVIGTREIFERDGDKHISSVWQF